MQTCGLVVVADVVQAANDKQQLEPMLGKLAALPAELGAPQTVLGDNGYFSAANVAACAAAGIEPLLALGRAPHHPSLDERFAAAPPAPKNPTPLEAMAHRLATPEGKKLYGRRKHTPEPVFGTGAHPANAKRAKSGASGIRQLPRTLSLSPRNRNCRKPRTDLMLKPTALLFMLVAAMRARVAEENIQ